MKKTTISVMGLLFSLALLGGCIESNGRKETSLSVESSECVWGESEENRIELVQYNGGYLDIMAVLYGVCEGCELQSSYSIESNKVVITLKEECGPNATECRCPRLQTIRLGPLESAYSVEVVFNNESIGEKAAVMGV